MQNNDKRQTKQERVDTLKKVAGHGEGVRPAKRYVPYIVAVALFLVICFAYMSPVLQGKKLLPVDREMLVGMAKEINDFRKTTGEEALWTNNMFGGMPAYLTSVIYSGNLLAKVQSAFSTIPAPVNFFFINFLMFFILCIAFRNNVWVSFAGALAYGFFSFFFIIVASGHNTKAHTLAYMPLVIGGMLLAYREKPLLGSLLFAAGSSWMINANHPQMYYYVGIMGVIIGVVYLIDAIRRGVWSSFLKTSALLVTALVLAVGTNFARLNVTWEYGKFSMRGKSELVTDSKLQTGGLDRDYILDYSYDLGEVMTAFIPRFKGGGMNESLGENSAVFKFMKEYQGKDAARRIAGSLPLYWGSQPISIAPFYYGAVLCFMFVLGLFVVKGRDKWWIVAVVIVALLLSLGNNLMGLSNFMIDYFPGYDKFRDVKNIIVIQQFAMALMGVLVVQRLLTSSDTPGLISKLKYTWFIMGGLAMLFVIFPGLAGDFRGAADERLAAAGWPGQLLEALRDDRRMVLRNDAFRSFVFVTLTAGALWLYIKRKLKAGYMVLLWIALILADMWPVNKRYFNNSHFVTRSKVETPFRPSKADQFILNDPDTYFRVLNLTVNVFNDASTSFFHKSLGGYHGAKMKRYQEVINHHLNPEIQNLIGAFKDQASIDSVMRSLPVINMLNTRFIIYNPDAEPIFNSHALGNAWFVDDKLIVDNANEEIEALQKIDPSVTAVIDRRFEGLIEGITPGSARGAAIRLVEYQPNFLKYRAEVSSGTSLAVFSDIWYPKGWRAFIGDDEAPVIRVNYLLRALAVPAGEHDIVFRFEPASYFAGNKVALVSSLILILTAMVVIFVEIKRKKCKSPAENERPPGGV